MANKENEWFPSLSSEEVEKLSTKYVPGNTEKMTKWAFNTFSAWRDAHNKKFSADQCPLDIFKNCKAATLNKWLARFVAEARKEDGSPYPLKTIQALLTGLPCHANLRTSYRKTISASSCCTMPSTMFTAIYLARERDYLSFLVFSRILSS